MTGAIARPRPARPILGFGCGAYLIYLGFKAVTAKKDSGAPAVGSRRPLLAGMAFGLTNPKSYPVAVAMFTAIAAPFADKLTFAGRHKPVSK